MSDPNPNLPPNDAPPAADCQIDDEVVVAPEEEAATPKPSLLKEEAKAADQETSLPESRASWEERNRERELREAGEVHGLRKNYTKYLFSLTCVWLGAVLLFVFLTGFKGLFFLGNAPLFAVAWNLDPSDCKECVRYYFALSDKVLIAFITSTTASVIGIFIIVAKWLFPDPSKTDSAIKAAAAARASAKQRRSKT